MPDTRNFIRFDEILQEVSRKIGDRIFFQSQLNIVDMGISDTGFLLRSGLLITRENKVTVSYSAPYALEVEKGRIAGNMPPVSVLEKWVKRKLGVPSKDARRVAWAVAMGIKKNGIQPQPFMEEALIKVSKERFIVEVDV